MALSDWMRKKGKRPGELASEMNKLAHAKGRPDFKIDGNQIYRYRTGKRVPQDPFIYLLFEEITDGQVTYQDFIRQT